MSWFIETISKFNSQFQITVQTTNWKLAYELDLGRELATWKTL